MTHTRTYTLPELAAKLMIEGRHVEVRVDHERLTAGLIVGVRVHNDAFHAELWEDNGGLRLVPLDGSAELRS